MIRTRVIPSLLLDGNGLIKTKKFSNPRYIGDPINAVKIFNDKEVDELILLDIYATKRGLHPNFNLLEKIASECFMPLAYGGGINNLSDAKTIFKLGIEKIVLNSSAVYNPKLITEIASLYGSQSVVVSIDYKKNIFGKYKVYTYNGKKMTALDPIEFAVLVQNYGAGELFCTSIQNEGTMKGYEKDISKKIIEAVQIPVIINGGAGSIKDISDVVMRSTNTAASASSIFVYQGNNKGVLINYFSRELMNKTFKK